MTERSFATALHAHTRLVHERTEHSPLMDGLVDGTRTIGDWTRLIGQLTHVYDALERVGRDLQDDPVAGPFVDQRLDRTAALAADLIHLDGPDWRERARPLPATAAYVQAIEATWDRPGAYVVHHWTRYLGDLSGGQALRVLLGRQFTLGRTGLEFYHFDAIGPVKPYKDGYHARLDALDPPPAERAALLAEAERAFELNGALFAELDAGVVAAR